MKTYTQPTVTRPGDGFVRNPDGSFRTVRKLLPVLNRAKSFRVSFLNVTRKEDGQATLEVHFHTGHQYLVWFASYCVCLDFAENPRRAWNRRGDLLNSNS